MTVFTYFHADDEREWPKDLLEVWTTSWARHGWTPVVLTERDARASSLWPDIFPCIAALPSTNGQTYERACYLRWLALHERGGGLMTDYDVVNRGFAPGQLMTNAPLVHLHIHKVPCAMFATPAGLETVFEWFRHPGPLWEVRGQPHCSDMHIITSHSKAPIDLFCAEFGDVRVNGLPLVHCASDKTLAVGIPKLVAMRQIANA